jgi:hypothetical protein
LPKAVTTISSFHLFTFTESGYKRQQFPCGRGKRTSAGLCDRMSLDQELIGGKITFGR